MVDKVARIKAWSLMRRSTEFTIEEVASVAGTPYGTANKYVKALELAGFLRFRKQGKTSIYCLVRDTGPIAPYGVDSGLIDPNLGGATQEYHQIIWSAMRRLREFNHAGLEAVTEITVQRASPYLAALEKVAYLDFRRSGRTKLYSLRKDTGIVAPLVTGKGVFDCNLLELVSF